MALSKKRLFVGNLPSKTSQADVTKKLSRFGNVQSVEMKQRSDSEGNVLSSFAFVDIETNATDLGSCFQYFKNELWHNQKVYVQLAKESFLERLKREQMSEKQKLQKEQGSPENVLKPPVNELRNEGRTGKLPTTHDSHGSGITFSMSKDETSVEKSKIKLDCVRPRGRKHSNKLESEVIYDERNETEKDWNGVQEQDVSRGNSLPMFGGTGFLAGLRDIVASDDPHAIQSHKPRHVGDKSTKLASPNANYNLLRSSCAELRNTDEVPSDVSERNIKTTSDRNGKYVNSNVNSLYLMKGDIDNCNPWNHNANIQHSRSEVDGETKGKKGTRIAAESSSRSNENKCRISPRRSIVKPKKDLMADRRRVNALDEWRKSFDLQKEAVKNALSSIDSKTHSNKKIIFDEDDQASEDSEEEKSSTVKSDGSKPKLFQDASDDEDIRNIESTEFKIKPHFEGHQGQKLLEIQSRYGNDSRFNLDERFLESDEESEGKEERAPGEDDLNAEKDHQLSILREMLGVDVSARKPKRIKKDKRDSLQMVRFDPTNPEHSKYVVKEEDLKKAKDGEGGRKGKKGEEESDMEGSESKKLKTEEEEAVPIVMGRFYKVSDKLKESLRKKTSDQEGDSRKEDKGSSGGFSLLQKFGSPPSDNEEEKVEYSTKAITRNRNEWEKNPFRYDSSEEEEEKEENKNTKKDEDTPVKSDGGTSGVQSDINKGVTETFYFQENDPRLQEGLDFFGIKKTFAEMQEGFHERRADLKLIIKAKVRNNKRRKRPLRKKLGGARGHKKKMAMLRSKS
ncbi:probable RNA-binding protein CG14230 [Hetaerina americana]|uniref:probable RNA-binding protein CG14230 n=1 Tax=Hetaerina americana TaxID=62018 RepID=UPI003A7F6135